MGRSRDRVRCFWKLHLPKSRSDLLLLLEQKGKEEAFRDVLAGHLNFLRDLCSAYYHLLSVAFRYFAIFSLLNPLTYKPSWKSGLADYYSHFPAESAELKPTTVSPF